MLRHQQNNITIGVLTSTEHITAANKQPTVMDETDNQIQLENRPTNDVKKLTTIRNISNKRIHLLDPFSRVAQKLNH